MIIYLVIGIIFMGLLVWFNREVFCDLIDKECYEEDYDEFDRKGLTITVGVILLGSVTVWPAILVILIIGYLRNR